jgi:hypothetical protein
VRLDYSDHSTADSRLGSGHSRAWCGGLGVCRANGERCVRDGSGAIGRTCRTNTAFGHSRIDAIGYSRALYAGGYAATHSDVDRAGTSGSSRHAGRNARHHATVRCNAVCGDP